MKVHPSATVYNPPLVVKVNWNGVWLSASLLGELNGQCAVRIPKLGRAGVQYVPSTNVRR